MQEVKCAAPGRVLEPKQGVTPVVRKLARLRLLYLKGREFSDVNKILYNRKMRHLNWLKTFNSLLVAAVTGMMFFFDNSEPWVTFTAAMIAVFVSTLNSWIQFKRLEDDAQEHDAASKRFQDICTQIRASVATVSEELAENMEKDVAGLEDKYKVSDEEDSNLMNKAAMEL